MLTNKKIVNLLTATFIIMFDLTLVHAEPFIPNDMGMVLYKIADSDVSNQKFTQRHQLVDGSIDWVNLNEKIRTLLVIGRDKSDPRYFGQAEALIRPTLNKKNIPKSTRILWADILQHDHQYSASLDVLDSILMTSKDDSAYWLGSVKSTAYLMRATIYVAQGDVKKAMRNCVALIGKTPMLVTSTCIAQAKSTAGELDSSLLLLSKQLRELNRTNKSSNNSSIESWAYTTLGEISFHLALETAAEKSFKNGLIHKPNDYYLVARYCDLLIEQKRFADCISLVNDKTYVTPLLLRAAISEANLPRSNETYYGKLIDKKLRAEPDTGRGAHLRDIAIYQLALRRNAKLAYKTANKNWQTQKQFEDALILVRAASSLGRNLDSLDAFHFLAGNFPLDSRVKKLVPSTYQKVANK